MGTMETKTGGSLFQPAKLIGVCSSIVSRIIQSCLPTLSSLLFIANARETMESPRLQDLVRYLMEVVDSSVEELKSCPCRWLQDARDNIRMVIVNAGTSSFISRGTVSQPGARYFP